MIDWAKPLWTKAGHLKARLLVSDLSNGVFRHAAAIMSFEGSEVIQTYADDGAVLLGQTHPQDLENCPEELEGFVNVYREVGGKAYIGHIVFGNSETALCAGKSARSFSSWLGYCKISLTANQLKKE